MTTEMRLSSDDAAGSAGVPMSRLDRWVTAGLLPAKAGARGNHGMYSLIAVVTCGAALRDLALGHDAVADVVQFVARLTQRHLEATLAHGRRIVFPRPPMFRRRHFIEPLPTHKHCTWQS
jgi:hypothetical protein